MRKSIHSTRVRFRVKSGSSAVVLALGLLLGLGERGDATALSAKQFEFLADTNKVHQTLRVAINRFQDEWRNAWRNSQNEMHPPLDLAAIRGIGLVPGDLELGNLTTDVRRYLSIICFINSPSEGGFGAIRTRANLVNTGTRTLSPSQMKRPHASAAIQEERGISWATPRQITARPNQGPQCPMWIPPETGVPPDEGEALDLAVNQKYREPVRQRRNALIALLDSAQNIYPEDVWITGQRVRFVFDQRDAARTLRIAQSCRGNPRVCEELLGLAYQQSGNISAAQMAFLRSDSIAALTPSKQKQCYDTTMLWLLHPGDRSLLQQATCERQAKMVETLWWLADPLWSVPGNDRYVEHKSRQIEVALHAIDERDERYAWSKKGGGDAMEELVIRYGWPTYTYWPGSQLEEEIDQYLDAVRFPPRFRARPYTSKEYSADRMAFIPSAHAYVDPATLSDNDWKLSLTGDADDWWPVEHMSYATKIAKLPDGQTAAFRRDTNIVFQLAVDDPLQRLDTSTSAPSRAELFGGGSQHATKQLATTELGAGHTLRLRTSIPATPLVLSAEVLPRTTLDQAMRLRFAFTPPNTLRNMKEDVGISEPVFMRVPNRQMLPASNEADALRMMAGTLQFHSAELLALYWESYGFAVSDTVDFELKFKRVDDINFARRIGSIAGIVSDLRDSVSIKWSEVDARTSGTVIPGLAKSAIGRAIAVDLKSLNPGRYRVAIQMSRGMSRPVQSEKSFVVMN